MFGLPERTIEQMQNVFARYSSIEKVIIYGSRAKGNYRPGSDIDLTLQGDSVNKDVLNKILIDLDDLNMPYLLDVSIFEQIESQSLIEHIRRVGTLFYERGSIAQNNDAYGE